VVHPVIDRYGLRDKIIYQGMPKGRFVRTIRGLALACRFLAAGNAPAARSLNGFRHGRSAWSFRLLFWVGSLGGRKHRFDVVHCHFGPVGQLAAQLRDIGAIDGAIVTTFHGVDVSSVLRGDPTYYRSLFARGDLFLPISDAWRARLVAHGCDPGRIEVHRMSVDLRRLTLQPRRLRPAEPLCLLSIGRLIEKKGVEYGVRAVARLAAQGRAVRYTIVGDGPERRRLETLAADLGLGPSVEFLGWRVCEEILALMLDHHVLLAPSVTDRGGDMEGIPVTIMEAMATGMPVISTWHSGIPELVQNGVTGSLVDERDVDALADAVNRLADHADVWEELGRRARARIERDYNLTIQHTRLMERYGRLVRRRSPPSAPADAAELGTPAGEVTPSLRERLYASMTGSVRDRFSP
jgi:colanic acid/amylovoran biosynthesis glycosyltransferase